MENEPAAALKRRRQALLRQLPPLKSILRGSLIERYKRCGKPGCKCAEGPGHGPKYYLAAIPKVQSAFDREGKARAAVINGRYEVLCAAEAERAMTDRLDLVIHSLHSAIGKA